MKIRTYCFPLALTFLFAAMSAWSWRKWPEIIIDFGRELYIPWQLSEGAVLYRDMTHIFGPASQYFNSFIFRVFGVSYTVLCVADLVLLAIFIYTLYQLISKTSSALTAFACCGVVLSLFSFSQYDEFGSWNFISPYAHEASHGIILSVIAMYQFARYVTARRKFHVFLSGLCAGLIFLMKTEIFLSVMISISFAFVLLCITSKRPLPLMVYVREYILFLSCCTIFPLLFFLCFLSAMDFKQAIMGVFGGWFLLLDSGVGSSAFYLDMTGFDDVPKNLMRMSAALLIVLLPILGSIVTFSTSRSAFFITRLLAVSGLCCIAWLFGWSNLSRSVPALVALSVALLVLAYLKAPPEEKDRRYLPLIIWAVFSFCLLGKMILNFRFYGIGFYLGLPSAVLLVVMAVWFMPGWLDERKRSGDGFRFAAITVILIIAFRSLAVAHAYYTQKTFSIGRDGDEIIVFNPGYDIASPIVAQTLDWLERNLDERDTVSVLPEGLIFNYLTKHRNPTRHNNFMAPQMAAYGEDNMIQDFKLHPPDYVVLVHKDTSDFGVDYFGKDPGYGMKMMDWITSNYRTVCLFGDEPLVANQFGIKIMKYGSQQFEGNGTSFH